MNNFDIKCYQETYKSPQYWQGTKFANESLRRQSWGECRQLTDHFYDELVYRGYLILRKDSD
ncbi:hypothetical protein [Crocosphaera chwakensis]|uniref:Uncharacterized protein n=1 Tax=Crocosphaera chwakensis CCY0110 TaxID=391612 RepID=A3IX65_9CHRO|nr:hypothetical protein [Crocosphaera chwakensis]EAZ88952.1 hypothetical protein CY0110_02612 [Crocosphaera chwakensis CCY0110]